MNPFLLIKIQEAHDAAVVAREALEEVLDTINLEGVESEEYNQRITDAEASMRYSIQVGLIPMDLVTLLQQQEAIPVQIKNHMVHIAGIMNEMKEYVEDAMDNAIKEEIEESLDSALEIAKEIENRWEMIRQIAEGQPQIAEGQPVHLSSNASNNEYNNSKESNNESNNEFSGGYKKRTLRKKRYAKRTEKRRAKRHAKRTLRKRSEKHTAKRTAKRHAKHREKRTKKQRYF